VGYGGTYTSDTPRAIATLPIGYADGWLRAFSGTEVTFHTKDGDVTAPIVGRICMDQCMVDVTDLPVAVGTPVTLFGETSAQLESLADRAHTIPYELLCLITARIPRVWGNDSKKERP
jgi:alanine racemase